MIPKIHQVAAFLIEVEQSDGTYLNVKGKSHNLAIERTDGDVSTLAVEVLDASLDPTQTAQIRMGRAVRFRVRNAANSGWVLGYTGKLDNVEVQRNPLAATDRRVNVKFSAVDVVAQLANTPEDRGVGSITHLRWLLSGRVPFNVNGQTSALAAQTIVARNDNASLWDQVLVTRESAGGFAWVDPNGTLFVWDAATLGSTPVATINQTRYRSVDTDFALDSVINSVTVNFRRYNIGTEISVDVPYGPYEDAASITQWGRRSAEFTIQAGAEDATAIANYAQGILDRSSTAIARAKTMTIPIRDLSDLDLVRDVDLNKVVTVVLPDGQSQNLRVTGISHTITAAGWLLELTFARPESAPLARMTAGTGISVIPPGSVGESELDSDVADTLAKVDPIESAVTDIETDIAAANTQANSGGSTIAAAIAKRVADFNAGLDTKAPAPIASTVAPGVTANVAGQLWERYDVLNPAGTTPRKLLGRWVGLGGTSWRQVALDASFLPQIDIGAGTFGSLSGGRLLANTVGVRHLIVTDYEDRVLDPSMEGLGTWTLGTGVTMVTNPQSPDPRNRSGKQLRITTTNLPAGGSSQAQEPMFPVQPGEQYACTAMYRRQGVLQSDTSQRIGVRLYLYDKDGVAAEAAGYYRQVDVQTSTLNNGSFRDFTLDVTIPDGVAFARFYPLLYNAVPAASAFYEFAELHCRRKNGGELHVDGSIFARHLSVDAVEAMLVTGKVLQTDAAANRGIKISTSGILGYDTTGVARTVINPVTGIIGAENGQFVGGSFSTMASGQRIQLTQDTDDVGSNTGVLWMHTGDASETFKPRLSHSIIGSGSTRQFRLFLSSGGLNNQGAAFLRLVSASFGGGSGSVATIEAGSVNIQGPLNGNQVNAANGLFDTTLIGGGTTGASINASGRLVRTSSAEATKKFISEMTLAQSAKVLDLTSYVFKYRAEMGLGDEWRGGFMAEQAAAAGLDMLVARNDKGDAVDFRTDGVVAAHNTLLRDLTNRVAADAAMIVNLTDRVKAIEARLLSINLGGLR